MDLNEIKQIIKNEGGKVIVVENGKPIMVIIDFEEYKTRRNNNFANLASFSPAKISENLGRHSELNLKREFPKEVASPSARAELPKELQEEELKIEDLPF